MQKDDPLTPKKTEAERSEAKKPKKHRFMPTTSKKNDFSARKSLKNDKVSLYFST